MALIYDITHTFSSYVIFGGLFGFLFYCLWSKIKGDGCPKLCARFMWFVLLIPLITYMTLKVVFPGIDFYETKFISGTTLGSVFSLACQVGYWSSLFLTPVLFVWLSIIIGRILYVFISGRKFRQVNIAATREEFPEVFAVAGQFSRRLGIKRPDIFILSDQNLDSFAFGLFKPGIVLDQEVLRLKQEDIRTVIAHELAHVYRKDALLSVIAAFLRDIMFFSPVTHWAYNGLMRVKEERADDIAVGLIGDRLQYGATLIKVWKMGAGYEAIPKVYPALGIAQTNVANRVERIIKPLPNRNISIISTIIIGVLTINILSLIC